MKQHKIIFMKKIIFVKNYRLIKHVGNIRIMERKLGERLKHVVDLEMRLSTTNKSC